MPDCVLNVSGDSALRDTRFRLLSNAGFSVLSANGAAAAESILAAGKNIDAVVICESISSDERKRVMELAQRAQIPTILVASVVPEPAERSAADATVPRLEDPSVLLSAVFDAIQKRKAARNAH